jgi:LacI family transcriptional regulator
MQLQVPADIAIAGFDDTPVATTVWPELTTIHQPIGDMGRIAVEVLVQQIKARRASEPIAPQHRLLPFTLEVREST